MPSTTRRIALVMAATVALPGCSGADDDTSTRTGGESSAPTRPAGETPSSTRTGSSSSPPSADVHRVEAESYPFGFEETVTFRTTGVHGWFFDGSFTKAVDLRGTVTRGGPVSVFVTEENVRDPREPDSTVWAAQDVERFEETVEVTDGNGSVLFAVERRTELDLRVEVTTI